MTHIENNRWTNFTYNTFKSTNKLLQTHTRTHTNKLTHLVIPNINTHIQNNKHTHIIPKTKHTYKNTSKQTRI